MEILALSTKLNQISYTYSVDPQKARNAKTNHPKWGGGSKMKILVCTKLNLFFAFQAPEYVYKIWLSLVERARILNF